MIEFSDLIKTLSMDAHVQIMIFGSPPCTVYRLGLDKSAIQQKIKEADERVERLYGRKI